MNTTKAIVIGFTALLAVGACSKGDNTTADTSTLPGADTTKAGAVVPTTDTVIKTTTTDTIQGQAKDTGKKMDTTRSKTGTKTRNP